VPDVDVVYLAQCVQQARDAKVNDVASHVINALLEAKSYPRAPVATPARPVPRRTAEVRSLLSVCVCVCVSVCERERHKQTYATLAPSVCERSAPCAFSPARACGVSHCEQWGWGGGGAWPRIGCDSRHRTRPHRMTCTATMRWPCCALTTTMCPCTPSARPLASAAVRAPASLALSQRETERERVCVCV
jgi:hypothetical protein